MSGMTMEYRGYVGQVELDEESDLLHGEVLNTRDVITFQGRTAQELREALRDSIEDYLAYCEERGEQPDRPYSGRISLRISPELHGAAMMRAAKEHKSLNQWLSDAIARATK